MNIEKAAMDVLQYARDIPSVNSDRAVYDYFDHFTQKLKVGIPVIIQGNPSLRFGVGKSYTALKILCEYDPYPHIDKVCFTPSDFVRAMDIVENDYKRKPRQVVVIDEAGILVNARKWYSFVNKALADAVMTFRELRGIMLFVTPSMDVIDKHLRMFATHVMRVYKVTGVDRNIFYSVLYRLKYIDAFQKLLINRVVVYFKDKYRVGYLGEIFIEKPSNQELLDEYERRVRKFKSKIRQSIAEIDALERSADDIAKELVDSFLEGKERNVIRHTRHGLRADVDEIREKFGVTASKARLIANRVNNLLEEIGVDVDG